MNPKLKALLREPTTYAGLVLMLGGLGININPDDFVAIASGVMAICGMIGIGYKEHKRRDSDN